jgi:hypothetical protein
MRASEQSSRVLVEAARARGRRSIISQGWANLSPIDQYYWAAQVQKLGVGVPVPVRDELSVDAMIRALRESLRPEIAARAQFLASRVAANGARIAASQLAGEFG